MGKTMEQSGFIQQNLVVQITTLHTVPGKSLGCIWSAHMTDWSRTDGCEVGALDTAT